jgi:hypothetical protein
VPREKNFKRLVRSRMAKTGESYTAARSHFVPSVTADPEAASLSRVLGVSPALLYGIGGGIGFAHLVFVYGPGPAASGPRSAATREGGALGATGPREHSERQEQGWTTVHVDGRYNALYFDKKGFVELACERLGVPVRVRPLANAASAEKQLRQALAAAPEVLLTVDLSRVPDAAPGVRPMSPRLVSVAEDLTVTGLPQGRVTLTWDELIAARWTEAKKYGGLYVFEVTGAIDARSAIPAATARTAQCLVAPSSTRFDVNFGVPGIRRWARLLTDPRDKRGWPALFADPAAMRAALDSVVAGLGGTGRARDAGRGQYAAFLDEAAALLGSDRLVGSANAYRDLARRWGELIALAARPDTTTAELAERLPDLADAEESAAQALAAATGAEAVAS